MSKFGPESIVGAASLLCGAPCENVIAAEVIACAISDELWRELYVSETHFATGVTNSCGLRSCLLLEALEQNTPKSDRSALEKLKDV